MKNTNILLIVDSNDDNSLELQQALENNNFNVHAMLNIRKDAELETFYKNISVLVCQFRHVKTNYLDIISRLVQINPTPVIIFTEDDDSDAIDKSVKIGVNAYIIDGFNSARIKPIIEVAISRFKNYQHIANELNRTRQQLAERKLIDKAKGILMKSKHIDEHQAYNNIRKMAMDKSKSMADISQSIIDVMDIMLP